MESKKIASFSYKFFSMLVDLFIILIIIIPLSLITIVNNNGIYTINKLNYYIWFLTFIFLQIFFYLLIPILTKGKTIAMLIFKLELQSLNLDENIYISIIKRNFLTTFLWILLLISFICFVPPSSAEKLLKAENLVENDKAVFSALEIAGISVPALFSPLFLISNLFNQLSAGINNNSISIYEKIYNYRIVHKNRFVKSAEDLSKKLIPIKMQIYKIVWIKEQE